MLIGILSDTHDRLAPTVAAVRTLRAAGAEYLLHCGDVGSEQIIDQLAGDVPAVFVWGNNDFDRAGLARYATALGVTCGNVLAELTLGGKQIAVTHGDYPATVRKILEGQQHDYLLVGHTHVKADDRVGRTRVINPGALHRAAQKTVAVLDTAADQLRFLVVAA
ncbi:MAG TPA: YfcE family phosphodiesterase [Tepidisphaeraceae bacterium]|nr:YfcE family phosphodiesterase [Tepidisphaeraceae bacterium]